MGDFFSFPWVQGTDNHDRFPKSPILKFVIVQFSQNPKQLTQHPNPNVLTVFNCERNTGISNFIMFFHYDLYLLVELLL